MHIAPDQNLHFRSMYIQVQYDNEEGITLRPSFTYNEDLDEYSYSNVTARHGWWIGVAVTQGEKESG
jgi:hypothetical protein